MSELLGSAAVNETPNFGLDELTGSEGYNIDKFNGNMNKIDTELFKTPLTVNEVQPDPVTRNIPITTVPLADNLTSDEAQINTGTFIIRTSGGEASVANGPAWLSNIKGNMIKSGYEAENIDMTVSGDDITAEIDRDDFVAAASASGTYTFSFTDAWSVNPSLYGITVTGTPADGDSIVVVYVKENRGTITTANPTSFISTGWNLYNHAVGYARVVNYSEEYGFMISGTYTALKFAETLNGEQQTITPVNGYFTVPANGYVFVTGGNDTDTEIWMTWSDWTDEANGGVFEAYSQTIINLSGIMVNFPNGLMKVGTFYDEINLNTGRAYSRIQKLEYTEENLVAVIAAGVPYDTDANYIYAVRETAIIYTISLSGEYTVSDHGNEMFIGTSVPLTASALYGQDLKNKLRRDVLTISQQTLTLAQKSQVLNNIGAASAAALGIVGGFTSKLESNAVSVQSSKNTHLSNIVLNKGVYIVQAVASFAANGTGLRQLWFSLSRAGSLLNRFSISQNAPTSAGFMTRLSLTSILEVGADNTTIYLVAYQSSGSTLSVDGFGIQAVRLK